MTDMTLMAELDFAELDFAELDLVNQKIMERDFQNFGNGFLNAPGYGQCFGNWMEQPPKVISRALCISDPQKPPRRFQIRDTLITISPAKTNAMVEPKTSKFKKYELKIQTGKKEKKKQKEKTKN